MRREAIAIVMEMDKAWDVAYRHRDRFPGLYEKLLATMLGRVTPRQMRLADLEYFETEPTDWKMDTLRKFGKGRLRPIIPFDGKGTGRYVALNGLNRLIYARERGDEFAPIYACTQANRTA